MTKEYRFKGVSPEGKLVQGTFMADSAKAAKQQLAKVELRYKLRIQSFEKKRDWLYKVFVAGKKTRERAPVGIFQRGSCQCFAQDGLHQFQDISGAI